jgi:hypothetical protein
MIFRDTNLQDIDILCVCTCIVGKSSRSCLARYHPKMAVLKTAVSQNGRVLKGPFPKRPFSKRPCPKTAVSQNGRSQNGRFQNGRVPKRPCPKTAVPKKAVPKTAVSQKCRVPKRPFPKRPCPKLVVLEFQPTLLFASLPAASSYILTRGSTTSLRRSIPSPITMSLTFKSRT